MYHSLDFDRTLTMQSSFQVIYLGWPIYAQESSNVDFVYRAYLLLLFSDRISKIQGNYFLILSTLCQNTTFREIEILYVVLLPGKCKLLLLKAVNSRQKFYRICVIWQSSSDNKYLNCMFYFQ